MGKALQSTGAVVQGQLSKPSLQQQSNKSYIKNPLRTTLGTALRNQMDDNTLTRQYWIESQPTIKVSKGEFVQLDFQETEADKKGPTPLNSLRLDANSAWLESIDRLLSSKLLEVLYSF
ncbi:hypothetical protein KEM48_000979 [Puccinia striiformis f. sp. tritici PST-130]|nr:hypothetical protein KEM48_000979 [Puccinia striiformis f. sp. tritici PST-130]